MIVAAAIKRNSGLIFTMPEPARHHTILNAMAQGEKIDAIDDVEQGFLTKEGLFVGRRKAYGIAEKSGQILPGEGIALGELFSEDLW